MAKMGFVYLQLLYSRKQVFEHNQQENSDMLLPDSVKATAAIFLLHSNTGKKSLVNSFVKYGISVFFTTGNIVWNFLW